jgi:hypothetical protein
MPWLWRGYLPADHSDPIRYTELDAIRRIHDAATSKRCAIAFNPKMRTIW